MDLVDYEDSVSACCGRHVDLLIEFADIIDGVVGGGVSSITLNELPCSIARHDSHTPHASPSLVGERQLMAFAKIRAQEVLPTPRGPQKR